MQMRYEKPTTTTTWNVRSVVRSYYTKGREGREGGCQPLERVRSCRRCPRRINPPLDSSRGKMKIVRKRFSERIVTTAQAFLLSFCLYLRQRISLMAQTNRLLTSTPLPFYVKSFIGLSFAACCTPLAPKGDLGESCCCVFSTKKIEEDQVTRLASLILDRSSRTFTSDCAIDSSFIVAKRPFIFIDCACNDSRACGRMSATCTCVTVQLRLMLYSIFIYFFIFLKGGKLFGLQ